MHETRQSGDFTWPALLAHWTAFAQSTMALPKNAQGDRWRNAAPAVIGLQAVVHALGDLDRLATNAHEGAPEGERALALDRAELLIRQHGSELHALWAGEPLHEEVSALIDDARHALTAARSRGWEWRVTSERLVAEHPADLVALLLDCGFDGDLYIATPGITLFRTCPAAFAHTRDGSRPNERAIRAIKEFLVDVSKPEPVSFFRQVYRQFDFALGRAVRDLVAPAEGKNAQLPAGQPLLVPAMLAGAEQSVTLPPRRGAEIPELQIIFG
jgi:hypothetical protein